MKNATYCLLFILGLFAGELYAHELTGQEAQKKIKGSEKIISGTKSNIPEFIQFRKEANIEFSKFSSWAHSAFSLSPKYDFRLLNTEKDQIGMSHYRYQQTYNGFPLNGTMYIVHVKNGLIVSMNGLLFDGLNPATTASWSEAAALSKALEYMNATAYRPQDYKGELFLAPVNGNLTSGSYRLAYRFDIYAEKPLKREYVFVDANTGEVILHESRINFSDSHGTAYTAYSGQRPIITDSIDATTYHLRDQSRGGGVETYNLQQGTSFVNTDFVDDDNDWNNINAQLDEYATDAHWGGEMTYDFFLQKFGRNSIDDAGLKLLMYVHYGNSFVNAFWDGQEMTFGDGNGSVNPLTALDVAGHEISHGLTQYTSNLGGGEAGALNEGFSDCMGNSIRQFGKNNAVIDWLIGDEMGGTPFRSMSNPSVYGDPDTYQGTGWDFITQEVHRNSTVLGHWYYLLTEGGSGTNDNGDAYSVTGLGIDKAAQICYRMNTVYLFPSAAYADARTYAIQAAIDLYGPCTNEVIQTVNAWHAVGIGNVFAPVVISDFASPITLFCAAPATVAFSNLSTNAGTFSWDFGDGSAVSTAHAPSHIYTTYGNYSVTLIADGGVCGIDTMTRAVYISVDSLNPCIVTLPPAGTGITQTACLGQLFDSGGPTADYADNTDVTVTISPVGAATVTLTFSFFQFENNFDYLYVYDGPTTASPLIGQYTGSTLPNGGVITSTAGSLTIRQTSDQGLTNPGFSSIWQCALATVAPTPNFSANTTTTCSGAIQFTDLSTNGPTGWNWDFGDGDSSALQSPSHVYNASGTYTVALTVSNPHGANSSTVVNYINVNLPPPPSTTAASICPGSPALLSASGTSSIAWYSASTGGTVLDTGNVFTTPLLSGTATYYAETNVYAPSQFAGPFDHSFGNGGNYGGGNYRDLEFNVMSAVKLVSVKVFAQGAGNRTITLIHGGITLHSVSVNIPNGESRVPLNWVLPVGTNFELGCSGSPNLYRNNSGAVFPYTLNGVVSITGTNAGNAGYYYFFYDWELQDFPCRSARTAAVATVLPPPVASYSSTIIADSVSFADNSTNATSWLWHFDDPGSGANDSSMQQNPSHVFSTLGIHNICLQVGDASGCIDSTCQSLVISAIETLGGSTGAAITVYPNPVNDMMTITFNVFTGNKLQLKLVDVLGKTVAEKNLGNVQRSSTYDWNVSSLAPGAYMLIVEGNHQKFMKRIIRQ